MKSRDFAFWLQGFFELGGGDAGLSATQVAIIRQHLGMVFKHDPDMKAPAHAPISPLATGLPTPSTPPARFPYPGSTGDYVPKDITTMIC